MSSKLFVACWLATIIGKAQLSPGCMQLQLACLMCLLLSATGAAHLLGTAHAAAEGRIDGAELKPAVGGKAASSQCAKDCIAKATKLGYAKVANDSMACFLPYKGKRLGTSDCCDKVCLDSWHRPEPGRWPVCTASSATAALAYVLGISAGGTFFGLQARSDQGSTPADTNLCLPPFAG